MMNLLRRQDPVLEVQISFRGTGSVEKSGGVVVFPVGSHGKHADQDHHRAVSHQER